MAALKSNMVLAPTRSTNAASTVEPAMPPALAPPPMKPKSRFA